jgi:hypothetical protein
MVIQVGTSMPVQDIFFKVQLGSLIVILQGYLPR